MCDLHCMSKNGGSQLFQSPLAELSNFFLRLGFSNFKKHGFYLNILTDPCDKLWFRVSLTELCLTDVYPPSLHLRL